MAFDTFVSIDGIEGESTDDNHQGWIEIISYETGQKQQKSSTASSSGGGSSERVDFDHFSFVKFLDKASPNLALACAAGTHIDEIIVELCRSGGEKLKYMSYKLINCIIAKVKTAGGPGEFPSELIKINFGRIEWCYTVQNRAGGGAAGNISGGWDLQRNCKV